MGHSNPIEYHDLFSLPGYNKISQGIPTLYFCYISLKNKGKPMKYLFVALLALASVVVSKPLVVTVCNPSVCYTSVFSDVRQYSMLEDFTGRQFLRIIFTDGRVLDVNGSEIKINK